MKVVEKITEKHLKNIMRMDEMQMGFMPGIRTSMQFLHIATDVEKI